MRKYSGATDSGKTGAMTLDLYRAWMSARADGKPRWAVAAYPHPYWAMRLAAQLYHDLGEKRFLRLVRVERIGDMDKVRMVRFVPYSENPDPWARMQEDAELLGELDLAPPGD